MGERPGPHVDSPLQLANLVEVTWFHVPGPMHSTIDIFSVDTLVNMATAAELRAELQITETR